MLKRFPLLALSACVLGLWLATSTLVDAISEQKITQPKSGLAEGTTAAGVTSASAAAKIDEYLQPLAATNNLSGSVMVVQGDRVVFSKSYGFADRQKQIPNRLDTRFHLASISMQFTAAAVMRLVEQGKLSLDTRVADVVQGLPNGERITVRELLEQNSGLPDANDLPEYDDLLKAHQTPESLVQAIRGKQPFAESNGKSTREEHSAFNVLALIVEKKAGMPFALAVRKEVFEPLGMHNSGIDDDAPIDNRAALGYQLSGTYGLKPAAPIHWSAKTGNGSAYSTVIDYHKWLRAFLEDKLLSAASRAVMLDYERSEEGFGWGKGESTRFGEIEYWFSGRAPGFGSSMIYLPREKVGVVVLANVENAACPIIARDLAIIAVGKPYEPLRVRRTVLTEAQRQAVTGDFLFDSDFYRPNATLTVAAEGADVILKWPGGPDAPLIPVGTNEFVDRYYWTRAKLVKGPAGAPAELHYGEFVGKRVPPRPQ